MTKLEELAIELHDLLWSNVGTTADWPLEVSSDEDEVVDQLIELLNEIQDEIKRCGYNRIEYNP